MRKGDRVRFTERYARTIMRTRGNKHVGVDWTTRLGTVHREPKFSGAGISVLWDGNEHPMSEPRAALEIADDQAKS